MIIQTPSTAERVRDPTYARNREADFTQRRVLTSCLEVDNKYNKYRTQIGPSDILIGGDWVLVITFAAALFGSGRLATSLLSRANAAGWPESMLSQF
jgi:hypothetical protein